MRFILIQEIEKMLIHFLRHPHYNFKYKESNDYKSQISFNLFFINLGWKMINTSKETGE